MTIKDKKILKAISYYQILGGVFGLFVTIYSIITTPDISFALALITGLVSIIFLYSIYCGQQLLQGNIIRGLKLSMINQLLQVIHISLLGLTYKYVAGLMVTIGIDYTSDLNLLFNFVLSTFDFTISPDTSKVIIGVNLTSIYLIYLLDRIKNSFQTISTNTTDIVHDEI